MVEVTGSQWPPLGLPYAIDGSQENILKARAADEMQRKSHWDVDNDKSAKIPNHTLRVYPALADFQGPKGPMCVGGLAEIL